MQFALCLLFWWGLQDFLDLLLERFQFPHALRRSRQCSLLPHEYFAVSPLQLHAKVSVHQVRGRRKQFHPCVWNRCQRSDALAFSHAERALIRRNRYRTEARLDKAFHHLHLSWREFQHTNASQPRAQWVSKAICGYAAVVSASEEVPSSCARISRSVNISSSRETWLFLN